MRLQSNGPAAGRGQELHFWSTRWGWHWASIFVQPDHLSFRFYWSLVGLQHCVSICSTPMLWPPDGKSWLLRKDPDAGKAWRQEEKGVTEDEMVGWHHRLGGHEFEQALGWWWTGRPGVLQSMGSQRVGHDWVTDLNWTVAEQSDLVKHTYSSILYHVLYHCVHYRSLQDIEYSSLSDHL